MKTVRTISYGSWISSSIQLLFKNEVSVPLIALQFHWDIALFRLGNCALQRSDSICTTCLLLCSIILWRHYASFFHSISKFLYLLVMKNIPRWLILLLNISVCTEDEPFEIEEICYAITSTNVQLNLSNPSEVSEYFWRIKNTQIRNSMNSVSEFVNKISVHYIMWKLTTNIIY